MERIVECVPNFSEGRNRAAIRSIVEAIGNTSDRVKVLNVDSGEAANRTVVTFAGPPEAVCQAAFQGARQAREVIDMRSQHGTHPRIGATDVLPIVPVKGISLKECADMARSLAGRMWKELGIPCYCYESSALREERRKLEYCRKGEYEGLRKKLEDPDTWPDFGPRSGFDKSWEDISRCGASIVGARDFLVAVNFNLDSKDKDIAMEIARDVRASGRKNPDGTRTPGTLPGCKSIGWYIEEYRIAQVSMNITDFRTVPLKRAYDEVCRAAKARGVRVTGTEIIGLVPLQAICDPDVPGALQKEISSMGLDDLRPFDPRKKILDYILED